MVFKRGDAWYTYVRYAYEDERGVRRSKRIRRKIGSKKSEAVEAEARIRSEIAAGTFDPNPPKVASSPTLFATFALEEFLPWSEMRHSESHHRELNRMLTSRLIPYFQGLHLHEITAKRIEDYLQTRDGQPYRSTGWKQAKRTTPATVNRELHAIKAVFTLAKEWGRIDVSPAAGVSPLVEDPNPPDLLSGAQVTCLLEEMPDHLRAAVGLAVYSGLRRSEILRLRWENVDLHNGVLTVVSRSGRRTKSKKDRKIPISPDLAELLRQHPRDLRGRLLFPGTKGERHDIRTSLEAAARRAGIAHIGMHQLRHTFCSFALMSGVDPRTVQQWMDHKDLRTTLRYAHVAPDHEVAAIKLVRYSDDTAAAEEAM